VLDPDGKSVNTLGRVYLRGMLRKMLHSECLLSSFSGGCHRRTLCVGPRGDLHTCLRGKWSGLWTWGDVDTGGLETWRAAWDGPAPFRPDLPEACGSCRWQEPCQGGCPSNAKAMLGDPALPDFYCPSFKRLFETAHALIVEEMFAIVAARREA